MSISTVTCPACQKMLKSSNAMPAGKNVRCPACKAIFAVPAMPAMEQVAVTAQAPAPILNHAQTNGDALTAPKNAPPGDAVSDAPRKRKSRLDDDDRPRKKKSRRDDDEEDDDRPRKKKSRRDEDDEDDDSPRKKKSRRDEDEEDDDQPRKKKSRRDEDEEDDDQPRKKKSRRDDDEDDDDPPARSKKRNDDDDDEDDRPRKKSKRKNKKSKKGSKVFILVGAIGGGVLLIGLVVLLLLFIPSGSGISAEALRFIPKDADSIEGYTIPTSGQPAIILRKTIRKLCDAAGLKGLNDEFVNDIHSFMTATNFAKMGQWSIIVVQMRKPQDAEKIAGLIDAKKTEEFKGKNVYSWKNGYLYLPNPNLVVVATIHDKDKEKEFTKLLDGAAAGSTSELAGQAQQLSHHQNWEVKKFRGSDADKSGKMPLSSHGYSNFAADGKSMQVDAVQVMANAAAAEEFVAKFKENQSKMKAGDENEFGNVNLRSSGSSVYMTITMSGKVLEKMLERM